MNRVETYSTTEAAQRETVSPLSAEISRRRQKLGQKAKQEPKFRFYSLYGRILEETTLAAAWGRARANKGEPGVDGVRIEEIEKSAEGLKVNRKKTRVVKLNAAGTSLDFLGYTLRYDRDLHGRNRRYLNMTPSRKAVLKACERIREMTSPAQCWKPLDVLIAEINRYLKGWSEYFSLGYPRVGFRKVNRLVGERLSGHMRRRSQRPWRPPEGVSAYAHFHKLGLIYL